MYVKRLIFVIILNTVALEAYPDPGDILMSLPPILKIAIAAQGYVQVVFSPEAPLDAIAIRVSTGAILGIPNAILLVNVVAQNPAGTRVWRWVTFGADVALATTCLVAGILTYEQGGLTGEGLLLPFAISFGIFALIDIFPFSFEQMDATTSP